MQESEITSELLERYLNLSDDALIDQLTEIFVRDFENNVPDMIIIIDTNPDSLFSIYRIGSLYILSSNTNILSSNTSVFILLNRFCKFKNSLYNNHKLTCKFQ